MKQKDSQGPKIIGFEVLLIIVCIMAVVFVSAILYQVFFNNPESIVDNHYEGYVEGIEMDDGMLTVLLNETTYVSMRTDSRYTPDLVFEVGGYYTFDVNNRGYLLDYEKLRVSE